MDVNGGVPTKKSCNTKLYVDEVKLQFQKKNLFLYTQSSNLLLPKNLQRQIISKQVKRKTVDDLTENPIKIISKQNIY